jgi:nucleotide-binding universal stress UspA family protein
MNEAERKRLIHRILVALDASPHSLTALSTAAELARRFEAELIGLFVEDINLVRVTQLPFAREVSWFSPMSRQIELDQLERHFRAQAALMRQALAAAAERENVPWRFRIVRGAVASEVLSAEEEADLTILGRVGRSLGGWRGVGSTVQMILSRGRRLTMVLQQDSRLVVPVIVLYDGSALARKALETAVQLVEARDGYLSVFVFAETADDGRRLQEEVGEEVQSHELNAHFHMLVNPNLSTIARAVQREGRGPVVLPCGGGLLHGENVCALVNEIPNPVLLVR